MQHGIGQNAPVLTRLRERKEWAFFGVLTKAAGPIAIAWWVLLLLRGILPAVFGIAMGMLVGAVQRGDSLAVPLSLVGVVFVLLQIMTPVHQAISTNLGDRTAAWLYDRLTDACVRPPGMGHLEDSKLTNDLTVARDFDLGMTGPPLSISMDFIAADMVQTVGGFACALVLFAYAWWAPIVLAAAWLATHWLLREAAVWKDRNTEEVRAAQRDADYAYRLAVDAPASKELRLFGLADWTIGRFVARRTRLHDLQYAATRLREKPMLWSVALVVVANVVVFCRWRAPPPKAGSRSAGRRVRPERRRSVDDRVRRPSGRSTGRGARRGGAASRAGDADRRRPAVGRSHGLGTPPGDPLPRSQFWIPGRPSLSTTSICRSRPDRRSPSSARTARARRRWPTLCRCTIRAPRDRDRRRRCPRDGSGVVAFARDGGFQDFIRSSCASRQRRPAARPTRRSARTCRRGAANLASLDTVLARGYEGGTDLSAVNGSASPWRARCAP